MKRYFMIGMLVIIVGLIGTVSVMAVVDILQGQSDGKAYAKTHNQLACVRKVTTGNRVCTEFSCFLNNRFFYQSCMANARPSSTLCDGIPKVINLFHFQAWKNKKCKALKRTDRMCDYIWKTARNTCKKAEKK